MFNYFESVNLTLESVELYKPPKSVEINSVGVNSTLDFLLCGITMVALLRDASQPSRRTMTSSIGTTLFGSVFFYFITSNPRSKSPDPPPLCAPGPPTLQIKHW